MSAIQDLYLYDHVWQVTAVDDFLCLCKDNLPMNNTTHLKAHKGLDNKLIFRALNPDRTPVDIAAGYEVYARILDPENRKVVLEKLCKLGPAKGLITLELDSGDIAEVHSGLYNFVLIRTQNFIVDVPNYYIEKPLFTDMSDNIAMAIEITEQAFKVPVEAITLLPADWTPDRYTVNNQFVDCFYSPRIPGGRVLNHIQSVHSFSTYTKNATGKLEIWGSLEETPDPYLTSTRWFKIYPATIATDIEYINYTGTQAWTFQANVMWIKFRWTPSTDVLDPGTLEKLIVRT